MIDTLILLMVLFVFLDGIVGAWRTGEIDLLARVWTKTETPSAYRAVFGLHLVIVMAIFFLLIRDALL